MEWKGRIVRYPKVMLDRPVTKGTRITVEFVLELWHKGWTDAEILQNYPHLSSDRIQACLSYAEDHGMVAFADWCHELCSEYWDRVRFESEMLTVTDKILKWLDFLQTNTCRVLRWNN